MVSLPSFFRRDKVSIKPMGYGNGYAVFFNDILAIRLFRTSTGGYIVTKDVNLAKHRGLGQFYVIYKRVCTAKVVIDGIEKRFRPFLEGYAVRFYDKEFLGAVLYDYIYYYENRKLNEEAGFEIQYCIELPEDIDLYIEKAKNFSKVFRILITEDGQRIDEWFTR
jgi:hypothetical protein